MQARHNLKEVTSTHHIFDELIKVSAGALFKLLSRELGHEINVTQISSGEFAQHSGKTEMDCLSS